MHTEYILTEGLFFVGNGKVAMGGSGADIVQLFAPCYSMPNIMSLRASDQTIVALNHRIRGSACYVTTLCAQGKEIGTLTDFAHPTLPVFIRRFSLVQPIDFLLESPFQPIDISAVFDGAKARLFEIPEGTVVFSQSKTDKDAYCSLLLSDSCTVNERQITFPAGDSHLIFVGGDFGACGTDSYACCMDLSAQMLGADLHKLVVVEHRGILERSVICVLVVFGKLVVTRFFPLGIHLSECDISVFQSIWVGVVVC
jgi:hypothetical protein